MMALLHVNIYDFESYREDQFIIFDKAIVKTGSMSEYQNQGYEEMNGNGKLVMPGLVNGHSHIYSTFARGFSAPFHPHNFKELLEQLWWKLDRYLSNEMTYYSGIVSGSLYLQNGVTTIIDHHASGEIQGSLNELKKAVCDDVGLRGVFCFETSDRFDVESYISENEKFIAENQTEFTSGLFGAHANFTLSDQSLTMIQKAKKKPIHIHVAESILDQDHAIKKYQKRVVKRLDDFGLIEKNSLLVHGLYLTDEELEIIKKHDAVVALNVTSNMNNAVGLPNYFKLKDKNIRMIIGNDGISMNMTSEYKMLYYSMHHFSKSPILFTFDDLIQLIKNTYEYVGSLLQVKLGKIQTGYESDFLLLDYNSPTPIHQNNIFGHLFFGLFNDFKPSDVFVGGKQLIASYQMSKQLDDKFKEAKQHAQNLWNKIEKEGS